MPTYETLLLDIDEGVATITLNRPEALNALSAGMLEDMMAALDFLDTREDVAVLLITGNRKAFAAGADIKEMIDVQYLDALATDFLARWNRVATQRRPTIAAVAGYALGGGCELAMMCDIIIAANNARFGQPEIKIGTIPGLGGTQRLTRLVGRAKAMDLVLTGRMMEADEAERAGLVSRVVPLDDLQSEARETARTIAAYSRSAIALARECVDAAVNTTLDQGMKTEKRAFHSLFGTPDQREGMAAFSEKRQAVFNRTDKA